mmetsp:Transcript_2141/g.4773  ORF Transcript_2141/g.4773 Transcript_2141/m.4773 type:complete len:107 (+) Transcript_2141:95-415(+)
MARILLVLAVALLVSLSSGAVEADFELSPEALEMDDACSEAADKEECAASFLQLRGTQHSAAPGEPETVAAANETQAANGTENLSSGIICRTVCRYGRCRRTCAAR